MGITSHESLMTGFSNPTLTAKSNVSDSSGVSWVLPRNKLIQKLRLYVEDERAQFTIVSSPAATGKTSAVKMLLESMNTNSFNGYFHCIQYARSSLTMLALLSAAKDLNQSGNFHETGVEGG